MQTDYAGFWRRFAASFLDGLIFFFLNLMLAIGIGLVVGTNGSNSKETASIIVNSTSLVLSVLYFVVYQQKMGQTLGKKAMGVRIVNAQGETPGMGTFALREIIGKGVSAIILGIGYLWMLWDPRKQCLHDKIASTFVVKV